MVCVRVRECFWSHVLSVCDDDDGVISGSLVFFRFARRKDPKSKHFIFRLSEGHFLFRPRVARGHFLDSFYLTLDIDAVVGLPKLPKLIKQKRTIALNGTNKVNKK